MAIQHRDRTAKYRKLMSGDSVSKSAAGIEVNHNLNHNLILVACCCILLHLLRLVLRDVGAGESGPALRQCSALLLEAWQTMKKRAKSSLSLVILDLSLLEFCSWQLHNSINSQSCPTCIQTSQFLLQGVFIFFLIFLIFVLGPQ